MRLCRYKSAGRTQVGLYDEKFVVSLGTASEAFGKASQAKAGLIESEKLSDYLPPDGRYFAAAKKVADWAAQNDSALPAAARLAHEAVELLTPIPNPSK